MIIDTTYLLPLARIEVETDLLLAIAEGRMTPPNQLSLEEVTISSISIFELQAKAAKLGVKPEYVLSAIEEISETFKIEPYYSPKILTRAFELKQTLLPDYIDCIIVATAIESKDGLITEDTRITKKRGMLKEKYDLTLKTYRDLISSK